MIYGKFTKKAETALMHAKEIAVALGHSYIGTEHILWGLAKEGTGIASSVLASNGINDERIKQKILELVGGGWFGFQSGIYAKDQACFGT